MHSFKLKAIDKLNNPEFWELNISLAIRAFAQGLVEIFIPLYLYFNGVNLQTIFLFYITTNLFNIFLTPFVSVILSKIGPKHSLILNTPFQIIFYLLIYSFTTFNWNIFFLAFILSLAHNFFRQGLHVQIIKSTLKNSEGQSLAKIRIMQILAKALSPIIGGLLTVTFSYNLVLIIACLLILTSNLPLLLTKDNHLEFDLNFLEVFKNIKWNQFWSFFGAGMELDANDLVWPIILVIFLNYSFTTTGIITAIGVFFSVIGSYFVGKLADTKRTGMLKIGVVLGSIFWGLRSIVSTGWQVFVVDSAFGFFDTLKNIPYNSMIYDRFREQKIMNYLVFHQVAINCGRAALFTLLFFFPNLILSVWVGAGSGYLHLIF